MLYSCFLLSAQSLHCNTLCEISRFIHVQTLGNRHIVAQQLQRNYSQTADKVLVYFRHTDCEVHLILGFILSVSSQPHQICATALALQHIADGLFIQFTLGQHTDDQRSPLDKADCAVLQLARSVCLGMDVADFFQLQASFQADCIVNATAHKEHIVCIGILCCKPLDTASSFLNDFSTAFDILKIIVFPKYTAFISRAFISDAVNPQFFTA